MKKILFFILIILTSCTTSTPSDANKAKIQTIYDSWQSGTKEEWMGAYLNIMSEDFSRWNGRYVGLGFTINNEEMTVIRTTGSPANDYFQAGDKFISVNGMAATAENSEELPFQGKIGEEITVVIERDGEEMTLVMERAAQTNRSSSQEIQQNIEGWDTYDSRPEMLNVNPLIAEGNEVWGSFELGAKTPNGDLIRWWVVERFVFNDKGELSRHAQITEDLFREAQVGGYITYD